MTTTSLTHSAGSISSAHRQNIIARHPIASALILVFTLAWAGLIPDVLASYKLLPFQMPFVLRLLTGVTPAIAAVVVTGAVDGRAGIVRLFKRFLIARVSVQWYLIALGGMAVMILLGIGLYVLTGGTVTIPVARFPWTSVVVGFGLALGLGFLFNTEEIFWRGFLLPRLQMKHTALVAALLIAIPESLFHLPYFFNKDVAFYQNIGIVAFTAFTVALTILFSWLFNNTRGSLLLVTLAHASQNAWASMLSDNQPVPFYLTIALLVVAAVMVVIVFGANHLVRGPVAPETGLTARGE